VANSNTVHVPRSHKHTCIRKLGIDEKRLTLRNPRLTVEKPIINYKRRQQIRKLGMVRGIGGREEGGRTGKNSNLKRLKNRRVHCVGYYCKYPLYIVQYKCGKRKKLNGRDVHSLCRIFSSSFKGTVA
jgi:hypothetical protein